ncbi:MAG: LysM peptidoglycan-binding domain-containing protein [Flavobacteriales bacterium]|nr:LysM peptidoglycan-binding domain-containing protein [Flavobacteriales bacterium]
MKRAFILIFLCFGGSFVVFSQDKMTREQYIETYKELAIAEMFRAGVPASITMAQGILESNNGNSRLAKEGNNHFGIKCKANWTGRTIQADDDAPDECFRAYDSPEESYRDHSDFLRENWRYRELFDLHITDYLGWAEGLRKAGYATNQSYHTMIINLIEKHQLYTLDVAPEPIMPRPLVMQNDVPVVYAGKDETLETIAKSNDITNRQIYKYNDLKEGDKINEGDIVYLKPKRRYGSERYHTLAEGETMYQISQQYGIKLKHLYKRNRLEMGEEPTDGAKIYMKGKRAKEDTLQVKTVEQVKEVTERFVNPHSIEKAPPLEDDNIELPEYHVVAAGDNIYRIAEKYHIFEEDLVKWNQINPLQLSKGQKIYLTEESAKQALSDKKVLQPKPIEQKATTTTTTSTSTKYHVVEKGETVYSITKKYNITADQLSKWNNLVGNQINVGQKLKVSE